MHHRISSILRHLRQDLAQRLDPDSIRLACSQVDYSWRRGILDPVATLHWFLVQILHGNTSLQHVARLAGRAFTDSAFCQARTRLPLAVYQRVLANLIQGLIADTQTQGLWRGHRTWLLDGSSFSMPDTAALQQRFGQPGNQAPGCGFPVAKMLALFHAGTGLLMEVVAAPLRTHEMSLLEVIHRFLRPQDLLVGDRGFCSFAHLALLRSQGIHGLFRLHQRQNVDFTPHRPHHAQRGRRPLKGRPRSHWLHGLGAWDQVVLWLKPAQRPSWLSAEQYAALPAQLSVRELRYELGGPGSRTRVITVVTTLLSAELYPREALADLYEVRWRVELNFRHLKITMNMDVLKCETVAGVLKELTVFAIVYNLVRVVMRSAADAQTVAVEQISFIDAYRWLRQAESGVELPALVVNPQRQPRYEPRVKKRRPKQYDLMNRPRSVLRKALQERFLTLP